MDWGRRDVKKILYAKRTRTAIHKPLSEGAGLYPTAMGYSHFETLLRKHNECDF